MVATIDAGKCRPTRLAAVVITSPQPSRDLPSHLFLKRKVQMAQARSGSSKSRVPVAYLPLTSRVFVLFPLRNFPRA